jgi:hypothetical protein
MQPNKATLCRDSVVALVAADTDAIALLDGTTPPDRYATQHASLRSALVRDLALAKQALSAIDSGKDTQAALDTFGPNASKTIVPVLTDIEG